MSNAATYLLRLPHSMKKAVDEIAKQDGTSVNQFIATAVAEKISAMNTAEFFAERRERADMGAFMQILTRQGGKPPCQGDEL
ncbi:YlcI/YnfO family protein [Methylovulum psychrotolerans]|uniref:Toxin-antitoxin system HicB family antitoxin n=1 Tax=Methylovulum psychrotolerans TaxID=1704499 RepID=A0A2S5CLX7_9GAMM|nr:YlcI/YnfO family protein [Methylovulum psychrotolerans]POZ51820.1 hypothetical protein AADEFJLK_02036 [Methylovulum psychrotolerans]